jgi:hypothetical protein
MEQNDFPRAADQGLGSDTGASPTNFQNENPGAAGLKDKARNIAGTAQERLADVGSTVRERAATAKDSLADALESGAEKLRHRSQGSQGGELAGATTAGSVATGDGRVAQVTDRLAVGMDVTADWLRDADLDNLKSGIERQVKEHPGRTLLIAVGLGYLLGKAMRK